MDRNSVPCTGWPKPAYIALNLYNVVGFAFFAESRLSFALDHRSRPMAPPQVMLNSEWKNIVAPVFRWLQSISANKKLSTDDNHPERKVLWVHYNQEWNKWFEKERESIYNWHMVKLDLYTDKCLKVYGPYTALENAKV